MREKSRLRLWRSLTAVNMGLTIFAVHNKAAYAATTDATISTPHQASRGQAHAAQKAKIRSTSGKSPPGKVQAKAPADVPETITVHGAFVTSTGVTGKTPGGGLMPVQTVPKSQSGITRDFIAKQSPTSNTISMISSLPGVVSSSTSPLGQGVEGMSIRGMNQTEIGFLFDGIPMADLVNLSPYTESTVDTDNIQSVTVSQGAPDISAPVYNAVGGLISEKMRDPSDKFGGNTNFSFGSKSLEREFIRLDSGLIGNTGLKAFASFSSTTNNQWRGSGRYRRYHVDSKIMKEWGDNNSAALEFTWENSYANNMTVPTMAQWKKYGISYNYTGNYYPGNTMYIDSQFQERHSAMILAPMHFTLAKGLTLHATPFYTYSAGPYDGGTTLSSSNSYFGTQPAGNLNLPYTTNGIATVQAIDPFVERNGSFNTYLDWKKGHNDFQIGYWYSNLTMAEAETFSVEDYSGNARNRYGKYPVTLADGQVLHPYNMNFKQQLSAIYLGDTLKLLHDRLQISAGFKEIMISRYATNLVPGAVYAHGGNYAQPLPQVAISYKITPHDQIFVNGTTAFRAPQSSEAYEQIFTPSVNHAVENPHDLRGEYSIGEEIGFRHTGLFNASISLFNYNMTHYQVSSTTYINNVAIGEPIDAGGKTARGVAAEIGLAPWHGFSPYASAQYLHATMDNDYEVGGNYLPTAGKIAINSPKFTAAVGLSYDNGTVFGLFTFNYVSSQYSTFMDDQKIPAYETANISMGYRLRKIGPAKHPQIQLNVVNIGAKNYLSGLSGVSSNANPTVARNGQVVAGSAPTYYVGGGVAAIVSLTTGF